MNRRKFFKLASSTVAVAAVPTTLISAALVSKVEQPQPVEEMSAERMRISSDGSISFNTNGNSRLTINPSGYAGIGTTPPSFKIQVSE